MSSVIVAGGRDFKDYEFLHKSLIGLLNLGDTIIMKRRNLLSWTGAVLILSVVVIGFVGSFGTIQRPATIVCGDSVYEAEFYYISEQGMITFKRKGEKHLSNAFMSRCEVHRGE